MVQQVLFIHSAGPQGEQEGSWGLVHYLRNELGTAYEVRAPAMPNPEDPKYENWKKRLKEEIASLGDGAVLVGHSIGGSALLKFLSEEEMGKSFAKLISVAAPFWGKDEDWQLEDFTLAEDFVSRNSLLPDVVLFHSIGDDTVPFKHLEKYMENLPSATIKQIPGNDHVFQEGLQELVDEIRRN
ncbi:alpha/beta hydrolase [Microbacterium sp. APC 3898]|uniref:Alpha/beta hydrolase n=2 Tax=Planococcus TaxID=1372 RepID=A0ABT7ZMP8_9BACL|nr:MULTISPECIES: alpha/beta hydrolase [Terrabacteria group]MBF6634768.1 alpha/beta hydrolase [Planococcus sp. (in: firmicutes)]MBD8015975.1 alpha/beta hydrolase [Planococcus wigleyi]MDN3428378.1 alpha/beta hydrolase [Planococcus sp. APC 4016]MDN3438572.1 alpha/beta hydrolase [Planococcus sp. APC 3900]MDN3498915.1 alpha/beta hydrolase [Microbacterium sp. APC 3898]